MSPTNRPPTLSVVIALISGKVEDLTACLQSLSDQIDPPSIEILVPYDDPCRSITKLAVTYPDVHFVHAEGLDSAKARSGSSREHHDILRSIGIRAARGRYVALTEDHATLGRNWCHTMVELLEENPQLAAIGGAFECGSERALNRAVYYCDFGRYQNPIPEGPAEFVSDANVVYRREALDAIWDAWGGEYREHTVHLALVERGRPIWLTPRVAAWQNRGPMTLGEAILERYVWGRSFAGVRIEGASVGRRLIYACLSPALPVILTSRLSLRILSRPRHLIGFLCVLPFIFLLNSAWAWGEFVGYLTGRPSGNPSVTGLAVLE